MLWAKKYDFLGIGNGAVSLQEKEHEKEQHLVSPAGKYFGKNLSSVDMGSSNSSRSEFKLSTGAWTMRPQCGKVDYLCSIQRDLPFGDGFCLCRKARPTQIYKRTWKSQSIIPCSSFSFPTIIFHRPHSRPHQQTLLSYLQPYADYYTLQAKPK
jgi:hypothetical protein